MSQIGNKLRAGYFRTPDQQGTYLKQLLKFTGDAAIFDPTCGEGLILNQLAHETGYDIRTYGVELDKRRAAASKECLDRVVQAPIESMVISHGVFGMVFLNPPYDHTMRGYDDEQSERKEYIELVRNLKYLSPKGVMVYIIPSYRFSDKKISRFLATYFEDIAICRFSDKDYDDFRQCVFIGKKKTETRKTLNEKLYEFLLNMDDENFIINNVTSIDKFIGRKTWDIPATLLEVPTFYTKIENKEDFIETIKNNKAFEAFKNRTKPNQLMIGGDPIINIAQGQIALLLASGAINGVLGEGDDLHAVQGMEIVSKMETKERTEHGTITKYRTKRDISVKVILPVGKVKKLI